MTDYFIDRDGNRREATTELVAEIIWGPGNYRVVEAFGREYVIPRPGFEDGDVEREDA